MFTYCPTLNFMNHHNNDKHAPDTSITFYCPLETSWFEDLTFTYYISTVHYKRHTLAYNDNDNI